MGMDTTLFCIPCGGAYPPHAKFCRLCGHPVTPTVPAEAVDSIAVASPKHQSSSVGVLSTTSAHIAAISPIVGTRLIKRRYRIVGEVGSGGYGKVYQAIDTEFMNRPLAIKEMLQQGLNASELADAVEGFKREAMLLAKLTHPNLPSIYDYFSEHGNWYLVMSFIEGETLDSYVRRRGGQLSVEKVLQIGIQLATVLSFLHTRTPVIVFRDLKPSNVMRTPEGQIYLIDFGIARHFKLGQSKDTMVLGSPGYAAPEQYGRAQTTPQTDVYSLGVVLHQLLTGMDPSLAPFRQRELDLPNYPQLSTLIQCMADLDIKKRPVSMGNIQRELQRIASGHVLPARVLQQRSRSPRSPKPSRQPLVASIPSPQLPAPPLRNMPPMQIGPSAPRASQAQLQMPIASADSGSPLIAIIRYFLPTIKRVWFR